MKKYVTVFSWCLLFAALAFAGYTVYSYGMWLTDSDAAGELMLGRMLAENGGIISSGWFYSTELRVLSPQLIWKALFMLTDNWRLVRCAGAVILDTIMLACVYVFCRSFDMKRAFPVIGILLLLPLSFEWSWVVNGTGAGFYTIYIAEAILLLCCARKPVNPVVGFVFAALISLTGFRMPFVAIIPVAGAVFAEPLVRRDASRIRFCIATCIGGVLGLFVNMLVLIPAYEVMRIPIRLRSMPAVSMLKTILKAWLKLAGYTYGASLFRDITACVWAALPFISSIGILAERKRFGAAERLPALTFLISCSLFVMLYVFFDEAFSGIYLTFYVVYGIAAVFLWASRHCFRLKTALALCVVMVIASGIMYESNALTNRTNRARSIETDELIEVCEMLEDRGYEKGLATFTDGNLITELSDGKLEVWVWKSPADMRNISLIYRWLQPASHTKAPEGRVFLLLSPADAETL